MDRRVDKGLSTRQHITAVATSLFTEHGYEAVSVEAILKAADISRGALYHHFPSKEAVFSAVLETVEARIADHLATAAQGAADPLDALRAGCSAWLALAENDATVRQVVLTDAPSVIGWAAWRRMDDAYTLGLLTRALTAAASAGDIKADRVEVYAHMLMAVLIETALLIARAPSDAAARDLCKDAVEDLLSGLLVGRRPSA